MVVMAMTMVVMAVVTEAVNMSMVMEVRDKMVEMQAGNERISRCSNVVMRSSAMMMMIMVVVMMMVVSMIMSMMMMVVIVMG